MSHEKDSHGSAADESRNAPLGDITLEKEQQMESDSGTETPVSNPPVTVNDDTRVPDDDPVGRVVELARHETARTSSLHRQTSLSMTHTVSRVPTATKPPSFSLLHETLFVAVISAAQLLTQAALAQSIAPLHVIGRTLNTTNPGQLSWLPAGYSLTVGTFILPAGRWGDLFGHKKLFVIGYFWFALWSAVAGFSAFSHSLVFFAFCRAMQGVGPAIMLPNGIAVLSRTYPPGPRKDMVLSLFGATAPGGFLVGAVFSGIFTQFVWWPWSYWVLGMVAALVGTMVIFVVPNMPVAGGKGSFKELDALGTVLGVAGLILFNFAWNQGPAAGWDTVYVYVLLIVGIALMVAFFLYEMKWAAFPLVPMSSFTTDTRLVFGCLTMGWASFGIWVFYLW
jgi:MFS family permease